MLEPLKLVIPSEHPMFVKEEDIIGADYRGLLPRFCFTEAHPVEGGGGNIAANVPFKCRTE